MAEKQFFSGRIPQHLYDAAVKFCELEGISKTDLLVNALSEYIGRPAKLPSVDEAVLQNIANLRDRVSALEKTLESLKTKPKMESPEQLIFESINDNSNVINDENVQIMTTKEVSDLTGLSRKVLEGAKNKGGFPKSGNGWIVTGFAGKQETSPYSNTWKIRKA